MQTYMDLWQKKNFFLLLTVDRDRSFAGLREVKRGCCGSGKFNGEVDCTMGTSLCTDRDEYLFWDKVHGTQAAYRWAVLAFFHGTARDAEPINLDQLLMAPHSSM